MEVVLSVTRSGMYTALADCRNYCTTVPQTFYRKFFEQDFSSTSAFFQPPLDTIRNEFTFPVEDAIGVMVSAACLLLLRFTLHHTLFKSAGHSMKLREEDVKKVPESLWSVVFYSSVFSYMCYLLHFTERHNYLTDMHSWYTPMTDLARNELWWVYIVELGYYLSAVINDGYLNTEKVFTDKVMMVIHHAATIGLIVFSYSLDFLPAGVVVLYCHDACDIWLDSAKIFNYLGRRGFGLTKLYEAISNGLFVTFVISWVYFRLYLFGVKTLYGTGYVYYTDVDPPHLYLTFNLLLHVLLVLHYIWFALILKVVIKVIQGEDKEDIREKEIRERKMKEKRLKNPIRRKSSLAQVYLDNTLATDAPDGDDKKIL
ncbi:hypothetical protein SARC_04977 [Sphaeroforma arctica JP610]|uniref:TLC domain-containing protein n=1 Tax=Sphaeroforma arctica JP610 TaxID=667725 RepID=A0A0L0G0Y5_9EUKA|nr:hypothetical protein SARC_04977 [Sphaeroforma arctica JP610]KNC82735.1 hypothetical protein SARC_04977 [Sphaeroforma arctica JP610]|eukprot:XP_014156637.1 hypothetical protein SARC_04977 [Sphaeroforma arctica JP610]